MSEAEGGANSLDSDSMPEDPDEGGPAQVDSPDYHHENHTAAQTCGWTANALRGEGKCYKNILPAPQRSIRSRFKGVVWRPPTTPNTDTRRPVTA